MDTQFLESFVMVVEHGSVAEAARRLNLTAAAVTQRIRALEREIGTALVSRSGPCSHCLQEFLLYARRYPQKY